MNIGEILLGLLVGSGVGGGASYFLQKSRISEVVQRYEQKYSQTRQALDAAETELKEKTEQLSVSLQSEERARTELQSSEATYQSNLEQIEHSYQLQMEEKQSAVSVAPELEVELEQVKAQLHEYQGQIEAYQAQILELQQVATPSDDLEPAYQARFQEIEQYHQNYIEELQQTYQRQLQEIGSAHQSEILEQQQTQQTQLQEIEQAYQNQILELEKTHQTQIRELEQAYQSQMLELQQTESQELYLATHAVLESVETRPHWQATEAWDDNFSQATFLETSLAEDESVAKISSLEELADLSDEAFEAPETDTPVVSREQDDFFASQTLIGDMGFSEFLQPETEESPVISREQDDFFASQTLIGDMGFSEFLQPETEESPVISREQDDFFASQTLIGDVDFLESLQSETASNPEDLAVAENTFTTEDSKSSDDFFHSQTLVGEIDFLEFLELETSDDLENSPELEDIANISPDFFADERSAEDDFLDLLPTREEMTADSKERLILESNNLFDLEEQVVDLDLFDPFETAKPSQNEGNKNGHTNGSNGVHTNELDAYHPDTDLDFLDIIGKEHRETSESIEIDDQDLNLDDLFSEDLFHSEWESSPKN